MFDSCAWLIGLIYFLMVFAISKVFDWIAFLFFATVSRILFAFDWIWTKTFGSQAVTTAVASAGEAQGRAVEFGARKFFAVAGAPIWKRVFFFFANMCFGVAYFFGLARLWLWEKTFGSQVANVAVATAEQVPERAIGIGMDKLDAIQSSRLGRLLITSTRLIRQPFGGVLHFFFGWLLTRNFRMLWGVIPVAVLAAPFLYVAIKIPLTTIESRADAYRKAAVDARNDGDDKKAALFERKLAQMNIADAGYDFRRAMRNAATVGAEETYRQMLRLAPHGESGFPRAHRWIAMAIESNEIELEFGLDMQETIIHHLSEYLSNGPGDPAALQMMAEIAVRGGKNDESLKYLRRIETNRLKPSDVVRLASSFLRADDAATAKRLAEQAVIKFEQAGAENQTSEVFLHWVAALRILRDYPGLAEILVVATDQLPEDQAKSFRSIGVQAIHLSSQFDNRDRFSTVARLTIQAFPNDSTIGVAIAERCNNLELARHVESALAREFSDGIVPVELLSRMGDLYASQGMGIDARQIYARIHETDPTDVRVTNNLAWLWATEKPIDLRVAMTFADEAVAADPPPAFAFETRGQVLFMLKRYSEARHDLSKALNGLPNYAPIHETLAKCYEQLGDSDLAARHATVSKRLQNDSPN